MECFDNKNIGCKNYENLCINCGTIFDYEYLHENIYRDYNMNISNMLYYKKFIYRRKKYLYKKCLHIREINNIILLFFDNSLEDIRKLYNMKRISIAKYLNSIYKFYCSKSLIDYQPIFKNKKIIDLNDDIIKVLEKQYEVYAYVKKWRWLFLSLKYWI